MIRVGESEAPPRARLRSPQTQRYGSPFTKCLCDYGLSEAVTWSRPFSDGAG